MNTLLDRHARNFASALNIRYSGTGVKAIEEINEEGSEKVLILSDSTVEIVTYTPLQAVPGFQYPIDLHIVSFSINNVSHISEDYKYHRVVSVDYDTYEYTISFKNGESFIISQNTRHAEQYQNEKREDAIDFIKALKGKL